MDYKYIEQLLDRYWECQTTLEEEEILRSFFAQKDVPVSLLPYCELFANQKMQAEEHLGSEFDERILALTEGKEQKGSSRKVSAMKITRSYRLRPFYQAAASVAVFLCLGMAIQQASIHEETYTEVVNPSTPQVIVAPTPETAFGTLEIPTDTAVIKQEIDTNL